MAIDQFKLEVCVEPQVKDYLLKVLPNLKTMMKITEKKPRKTTFCQLDWCPPMPRPQTHDLFMRQIEAAISQVLPGMGYAIDNVSGNGSTAVWIWWEPGKLPA